MSQPADGETIKNAMPLIKANLAGFGAIDPGIVQMRVSGLGLVSANYDPKTQNRFLPGHAKIARQELHRDYRGKIRR